jgi:channel protein (hemolysin III family)
MRASSKPILRSISLGQITGAIGATVLLALAAASANTAVLFSVLVYGIGLVAMPVFSAVYHLQRSSRWRDLLRRLDHSAVFVLHGLVLGAAGLH